MTSATLLRLIEIGYDIAEPAPPPRWRVNWVRVAAWGAGLAYCAAFWFGVGCAIGRLIR